MIYQISKYITKRWNNTRIVAFFRTINHDVPYEIKQNANLITASRSLFLPYQWYILSSTTCHTHYLSLKTLDSMVIFRICNSIFDYLL